MRPTKADFTDARLRALRAPPGFRVGVFASKLGSPRMMAVGDDGTVYVTRPDSNDVISLRDVDTDLCAQLQFLQHRYLNDSRDSPASRRWDNRA